MLLECLRAELRLRHYSVRTERAYVGWVRRFVEFNQRKNPRELDASHVAAFLNELVRKGASCSSHHQALCAIIFLYQNVLGLEAP